MGGLLGGRALTPSAEQFFRAGASRPDVIVLFLGSKVWAVHVAINRVHDNSCCQIGIYLTNMA